MITIIFLDEQGKVVHLQFSRDESLDDSYEFGVWDINTNRIRLNTRGWDTLIANRSDIRKIRPMMDRLVKIPDQSKIIN